MAGKTIVITGASDGIGVAAARALTAAGHTVVVVGRSPGKTKRSADVMGAPYFISDFAELSQVRSLAESLQAQYPRIDVLANNAGGIFGDPTRTVDGFERTLQINHLAPFLLTNLLIDNLTAAGATVINTSSVAAKNYGSVNLDDLNNETKFSANKAYGDAKLGNILFTKELNRRYHPAGISTAAFHPGIVSTNFASGSTSSMRLFYQGPFRRVSGMVSPEKGADQLVWLATSKPGVDWRSGEYYVKRAVGKTNPQADDAELARKYWDLSAEMVGLAKPVSDR